MTTAMIEGTPKTKAPIIVAAVSYADEKAQGMQGIHQVSNGDERWRRFGGKFGFLGH